MAKARNVADQERLLAEIRQATRQVNSGHYIKHEDMKAWLLSWGTDQELPPPKGRAVFQFALQRRRHEHRYQIGHCVQEHRNGAERDELQEHVAASRRYE